jgi:hypothetical protein
MHLLAGCIGGHTVSPFINRFLPTRLRLKFAADGVDHTGGVGPELGIGDFDGS